MRVLQVRFHDDIDGSSLARAISASTGPLLLPFDSGFPTHTCFTTCYIGYNSPNVMYYLDLGGLWIGYLFGNEILRNFKF